MQEDFEKGLKGEADVDEEDIALREVADGRWRDWPFAVAYYLSLVFSLVVGIYLIDKVGEEKESEHDADLSFVFNPLQILLGVLAAVVFTVLWLLIVILFARCIIKSTLILMPILWLICAILTFTVNPVMGVFLLLIAAFLVWYAYAVWNRAEFAAECLTIAIDVFKSFHAPIYVSLFMGFVSCALLAIDCLVLVGVADTVSSSGASSVVLFFLLCLIYWHNIVSINVAHVTASGVMGTWFYTDIEDGATTKSFRRAVTTSFGSICFGALIEAMIRALQAMVRQLQRRNRGNMGVYALLCILHCVIRCLGDIVEYVNSYAFVFVALYGTTYLESAKGVWAIFKSRGIEALINDDLTSIPLWVGAVLNVLIVVLVSALYGGLNGNLLVAALFGVVIYFCCVHTLISYVKTLYVCWINDPATFAKHRPQQFEKIVDAANKFGYDTQWCN